VPAPQPSVMPRLRTHSTSGQNWLLPSTSVDELFAEMLRWFGVSSTDLATVLPNITNFYDPYSSTLPLGFVKNGMWT
jgi:hypothetical protein